MKTQRIQVFISSAMNELHNERIEIAFALKFSGFEAYLFEHGGANPSTTRETYMRAIEESDVYLGMFWNRFSIATLDEYRYAEQLRKPCFIYVKKFDSEPESRLRILLEEIAGKHRYSEFDSTLDLKARVLSDVMDWLVEQYRAKSRQLEETRKRLEQFARLHQRQTQEAMEAEQQSAILQDETDRLKQSLATSFVPLRDAFALAFPKIHVIIADIREVETDAFALSVNSNLGLIPERIGNLDGQALAQVHVSLRAEGLPRVGSVLPIRVSGLPAKYIFLAGLPDQYDCARIGMLACLRLAQQMRLRKTTSAALGIGQFNWV